MNESLMTKQLHGRQRAGASIMAVGCVGGDAHTLHSVAGLPGGLVVVRQNDTAYDAVVYVDDDVPWRRHARTR